VYRADGKRRMKSIAAYSEARDFADKKVRELAEGSKVPALTDKQAGDTIACSMEMRTLACKMLGAPSGSHFITSDNPVVVLNQFCAGVEPHRNFAGFGRAGFQALLPISPEVCLLFYDAKVYKVGSRRHSLVEVSKADVEIINSLQIQSAENRVYFHDTKLAREVEDLIAVYGNLRIPVEDFLRTMPGKNPNEELWHFRAPSVRLPRTWSYCRLRRRINLRIGDRRDSAWSALIEEVGKDFEQNPNGGDLPTRVAKIIADPNRRPTRSCAASL
jgi:hypothetical protein